MTVFQKVLRAAAPVLVVAALVVAMAAPVSASSIGRHPTPLAAVKTLPTITLTPGEARLVNGVINFVKPVLCPVIAKLAAPAFQAFAQAGCQALGSNPQPIQQVISLLQALCEIGPSTVLPSVGFLIQPLCPLVA